MTGALSRAFIAAAIGLATIVVLVAVTAMVHGTTPGTLLTKYWFVYLPAVALPPVVVFAAVAVHNWIASGDPQKEM